jgi:hypothetical protein
MTTLTSKPRRTSRTADSIESIRVNARLDKAHAEKLQFLMKERRCTATEALKFAIERGYDELRDAKSSGRRILDSLVGAFSGGPPDMASRYKEYLSEGFSEKKRVFPKRKRGHR